MGWDLGVRPLYTMKYGIRSSQKYITNGPGCYVRPHVFELTFPQYPYTDYTILTYVAATVSDAVVIHLLRLGQPHCVEYHESVLHGQGVAHLYNVLADVVNQSAAQLDGLDVLD